MTEIGTTNKDDDLLYKICKEIDILVSILSKEKYYKIINGIKNIYKMTSKRKKQIKKALHLKYNKLKNMKQELHNKTINYLIKKYARIIVSPFQVKQMASKLYSTTARKMFNLSHYEFRMKLKNKCGDYDIEYIEKEEHYTSKTCTRCGIIKTNLGVSKIFCCSFCNITIDRDYVGSRGIMLKNNVWN